MQQLVKQHVSALQLHKLCWTQGSNAIKQLTYAEFGDLDSDNVVFYQHGWPGSRIGGSMLHEAAQRLCIRLIAVDRPGFGGTPFTPHHSLSNWALALQQLSDHLQIQRFGVLGASGGAPFAAACARFIGEQRVTGLGLLCPLGPVDSSTRSGMAAANTLLLAMARRCPVVARGIWRATRQWLAWDEQCMQRFVLNPQDKQALLSTPHIAQAIRAAVLEGLSAGAWGVVHEMALAQRCWGFRLDEIRVQHAFLWHGLQDPLVTLAMARAYESIPGCQAVYFPSETHTTLVVNRLCLALEALAALPTTPADNAAGFTSACNAQQQVPIVLGSSSTTSSIPGAAAAADIGAGLARGKVGRQLSDALSFAEPPVKPQQQQQQQPEVPIAVSSNLQMFTAPAAVMRSATPQA